MVEQHVEGDLLLISFVLVFWSVWWACHVSSHRFLLCLWGIQRQMVYWVKVAHEFSTVAIWVQQSCWNTSLHIIVLWGPLWQGSHTIERSRAVSTRGSGALESSVSGAVASPGSRALASPVSGAVASQGSGALESSVSGALESSVSGAVASPGSRALASPVSGAVASQGSGALESPVSGALASSRVSMTSWQSCVSLIHPRSPSCANRSNNWGEPAVARPRGNQLFVLGVTVNVRKWPGNNCCIVSYNVSRCFMWVCVRRVSTSCVNTVYCRLTFSQLTYVECSSTFGRVIPASRLSCGTTCSVALTSTSFKVSSHFADIHVWDDIFRSINLHVLQA